MNSNSEGIGNPIIPNGTNDAAIHAKFFNDENRDTKRDGAYNNGITNFAQFMQNRGCSPGKVFESATSNDIADFCKTVTVNDQQMGLAKIYKCAFDNGLIPKNTYAEYISTVKKNNASFAILGRISAAAKRKSENITR